MDLPKIFVRFPGRIYDRYAKASIRERISGKNRYRYLKWREGSRVKEYYLGKLPHKRIDRHHV